MKFIPYGKQWISGSDKRAVLEVLKSDFLTQGPLIAQFEKTLCRYTGAKYCVAVANGTAALHLAVLSLDIKPRSEGITSPNTFSASANCFLYAGIKPVLADIDKDSYNIDPKEIRKKVNKKTKVITAVDFAGRPAAMKEIHRMAKEKKIYVIEDASHAIGSKYDSRYRVGSCRYSDLTTFSFHPVKTITTGEGGAITTNNPKLYQRLLLLRGHGINKNIKNSPGPWYYEMEKLGFNYRLTDIQAALGISQLIKIDRFVAQRQAIVKKYNRYFAENEFITTPLDDNNDQICYHLYVVKIDFKRLGKTRKQVMLQLNKYGIGTQVHYIPIYMQPYYKQKFGFHKKDFPAMETYYRKCLSLPLYPKMTNRDVERVIYEVKNVTKN